MAIAVAEQVRPQDRRQALYTPARPADGAQEARRFWQKYPLFTEERLSGKFAVRVHHQVASTSSTLKELDVLVATFASPRPPSSRTMAAQPVVRGDANG